MSDYLERLERELLAAGRRAQALSARQPRSGRRLLAHLTGATPVVLSVAVTIAIIAVVVATGALGGTPGKTAQQGRHIYVGEPSVSRARACRPRHTPSGLPPLVDSSASPGPALQSILTLAREPGNGTGVASLGAFDRDPVGVLTVYRRYIRIVAGEKGTKLAFFPAVVCNQVQTSPAGRNPPRMRIAPAEAIVMLVLSNPGLHPAILAGTPATILNGPADPGLDLPDQRGWIQATVVPDGVARVVMHFTPPFLHHYTVTMMIQHNIGVAVRKPDYTPTTVYWYAADGHLIKTFIDRKALRYDNCLAKHEKNCLDGG